MAKISAVRDMSSEQLRLLLKDTTDHLFRLRIQSQTEKLDTPSELKKNRRLIARIQTVQRQRALKAEAAGPVTPAGEDSSESQEPEVPFIVFGYQPCPREL
jgi:large subunit ribosomal protein L29